MKKVLRKRLSWMLALTMAVSVIIAMPMESFAIERSNFFGERDAYFEGFDTDATISIGTDFEEVDIFRTKHSWSNASVAASDGKLVFTKSTRDGDEVTTDSAKGQGMIDNVYLKFDKEFDVSANTTKKLFISYNVTPISANFNEYTDKANTTGKENTSLYRALPMTVAPIYYDAETKTATKLSGVQPGGYWTNSSCMTYLLYKREQVSETDTIEKVGMGYFIGNANRSPIAGVDLTDDSTRKYSTEASCGGGIINNDLNTVYTVTLEVTPATASDSAKISKVTITDGTYTYNGTDFIVNNGTNKGILSGTTISGLNISLTAMQTVEIDNIVAYYEPSGSAVLTASVAEGSTAWSKVEPFEVNFDGLVNPIGAEEGETKGIIVEKVAADNTREDITDDVVFDWTYGNTTTLKITVAGMSYSEKYAITIPSGIKTINGNVTGAQELIYITEAAPEVNCSLSGKLGETELINLSDAAGKFATFKAVATPEASSTALFIIAIYDGDEILRYAAQDITFVEGTQRELTIGFKVPSEAEDLMVKAFVCENINSLTPFGTAGEID